METYYRKRSKKAQYQPNVIQMDQCCQKEAGQGSITAAEPPLLGRLHLVPPPPLSDHCTLLLKEQEKDRGKPMMQNYIKEGYIYEIDHVQLPPRTPVQLRSNIRVAMVCEKTEMTVSVRFPSMESLRAFFNYSRRETHPALDEKFVMGSALAVKVLSKLVSPEIFSEQKSLESFWLVSSSTAESCKDVNVAGKTEKGICLSELKGNGMVRWGIRRQVKYLGRHKESEGKVVNGAVIPENSSSSFVNGVEMSRMETGDDDDDERKEDSDDGEEREGDMDEDERAEEEEEDEESGDDQENEEEEEDDDDDDEDEEVEEKIKERNKNLKRKRYSFRNIGVKKPKKERPDTRKQKQKHKKKKKNQFKKNKGKSRFKAALVLRDPKDRWSSERYKLAEENLLRVMSAKGATAENPILRPQLRAEARKKIGDTGLLDHLLKHMAGKIAPGGEERFRRRHNPDGAMEYWLESADLVNIRREAGVTDPYWVPPPGWKPGDSPTQDPICARELKLLKDDISKIKRDLELMATKMQLEEEVGKLRRELDEISAKKRHEESRALIKTASSHCCISQKLEQLVASSKFDFDSPPVSMEKCKEQLMAISDFVKEIEGKIVKLIPNMEERATSKDSSLMAPTDPNTKERKSTQQEVQALIAASESGKDQTKAAEEKAAKIQRLKSGFRICKPQGTFLWPNMVKDNINSTSSKMLSPQVVVQVEVPTPTSVTSSTASAPPLPPYHHHHPASLVKPVAEKRAVTVTVSTVSKGPNYEYGANNYSSTTTTTTALINLNDAPVNHPSVMPMLSPSGNTNPWESGARGPRNDQMECNTKCCNSSATSLPSEASNWLALSNFKSASDESSHG